MSADTSSEVLRLLRELNDKIVELNGKVDTVEERLTAKITDAEERLNGKIGQLSGAVNENRVRAAAAEMFGKGFAKNFVARSLYDATMLIKDVKPTVDKDNKTEKSVWIVSTAKTLARKLLDHPKLVDAIEQLSLGLKSHVDKFVADCWPAVHASEPDRLLGDLASQLAKIKPQVQPKAPETFRLIINFKDFLTTYTQYLRDKPAYGARLLDGLLSCDGLGLQLLLMLAAIFSESDPKKFVKSSVEFDCRGRCTLIAGSGSSLLGSVELGEIKSSTTQAADAEAQLVLRCWMLTAAMHLSFGCPLDTTRMIGRIFIASGTTPVHERAPVVNPKQVSIYFHYV